MEINFFIHMYPFDNEKVFYSSAFAKGVSTKDCLNKDSRPKGWLVVVTLLTPESISNQLI